MPKARRRRGPAIFAAVALAALAGPAAASASFDAHIEGSRAIFNGTDAPEKLRVTQNGNLLMHDQTSPAFAGPFDFDSTQPGIQVLQAPDGQIATVEAHGGGGDDVMEIAAPRASARLSGDAGNDTLIGSDQKDMLHGGDVPTRWSATSPPTSSWARPATTRCGGGSATGATGSPVATATTVPSSAVAHPPTSSG